MTFNYTSVQRMSFTPGANCTYKNHLRQINLSFCVSKLVSMLSVKAVMGNLNVILTRNVSLLAQGY